MPRIDHPERLHSMTSVMSRMGEPGFGESSEEALAILMTPPPVERSAYIERQVEAHRVYGSKPEWLDEDALAARRDRVRPLLLPRQILIDVGRRAECGATSSRPGSCRLVIHGSRGHARSPSGGRRTAELIPGARDVEIEGMGHDYPVAVWWQWVAPGRSSPDDSRRPIPAGPQAPS